MGGRRRWSLRVPVVIGPCAALVLLLAVNAVAETRGGAFYRIFLAQGDDLITYGDYARVGDRVVFALPLGLDPSARHAQLVSIPAGAVDWTTTERYADAVRASRYAGTRGEADFARLSADVARSLNDIAFTDSDDTRAALARQTKRQLLGWADAHYGYRADDIVEIVTLLDAAIDPGAPADEPEQVSLSLVATTEQAPVVPLFPPPTLQEVIASALIVAGLTPVPVERVSLLRATITVLDNADSGLDAEWCDQTRAAARAELDAELRMDARYASLGRMALEQAAAYARQADVRGVQSVLDAVREQDAELGRRRPNHFSALFTTLERRLMDARVLRLERDRLQLRADAIRAYQRDVAEVLQRFGARRSMLDDIRCLAGPDVGELPLLSAELTEAARRLKGVAPPAEIEGLHALIRQALTLAESAARGRYQAAQDADLQAAWDSAAAAAGAIMFFARASEELELALSRP